MAERDPLQGREVIFEFMSVADSVRVAAVDVETGVEVTVVAAASALRADMERIAARKLARKLGLLDPEPDAKTPRRGGRGVIV